MIGCECEKWSLRDLASALQNMHKANKRIVVPMFQRGKRWNSEREHKFIDSLKKGYPVGTMLFYEKTEDGQQTYVLVDGLQRSNCIRKFINNPTDFIDAGSIPETEYQALIQSMKLDDDVETSKAKDILANFVKERENFKDIQTLDIYKVAKSVVDEYGANPDTVSDAIQVIDGMFIERRELYNEIANSIIPVLIYSGDESNLPEIFDRINSEGEKLNQFEIYAAAWPITEKFTISNSEIVEHVIKKYDMLANDGFIMHGYNKELMRNNRQLNAFEYIFGLGKFLVEKYEMLSFDTRLTDDTVNPLGFELINACLNDNNQMPQLYKKFTSKTDVKSFEKALIKAVEFVEMSITPITRFKGNKRNANRKFHAKYQILSMIAATFKEMYDTDDYRSIANDWESKKDTLSRNLFHYYIYDIITGYWREGGTGKVFQTARTNKYMTDITNRQWIMAIDNYYETTMSRIECDKPHAPSNEDYVILNCIYLNTFTAKNQLSLDKFDIEHIAPKKQMEKLIKGCKGQGLGLPISSITNLCYLPESVNRSKGAKNFYQDKKYLRKINITLDEVEAKYSFTKIDDLEWMDMPYDSVDDFQALKEYYTDYCNERFNKMKHLLCESLGIDYVEIEAPEEDGTIISKDIDTTGYHDFVLKQSSDVDAIMRYYPIGRRFVIQAGSKVRNIREEEAVNLHNQLIAELREEVFSDEKRARVKGNSVILLEDIEIPRQYPSPAACFCTGTSMQGTTEWKDIDDKKRTFIDLYPKSKETEDGTVQIEQKDNLPVINRTSDNVGRFSANCAIRLAKSIGEPLSKLNANTYKTEGGKKGFIIYTSKIRMQGDRERFLFSYRRKNDIADCEEQYCVFGCKDENTILVISVSEIEAHIDSMLTSNDEDGNPIKWHVCFFKDIDGHIRWLLSKPETREIDVTDKLLDTPTRLR